jgi:hypothetical protein
MITNKRKVQYRVRYHKVVRDLSDIYRMEPKEKYMYKLMDTVIFQDFETALDGTIEDFKEAHNDNEKKA